MIFFRVLAIQGGAGVLPPIGTFSPGTHCYSGRGWPWRANQASVCENVAARKIRDLPPGNLLHSY